MTRNYMLDTNIFNAILDGNISINEFIGKARFYITHVQYDEIQNTRDNKRRSELTEVFEQMTNDSEVPTESFVLDVSVLGKAKLTADDNICKLIKAKLDSSKRKENNIQDSLMAETAIKNNLSFVTLDNDLFEVVNGFGGTAIDLDQLLKELNHT